MTGSRDANPLQVQRALSYLRAGNALAISLDTFRVQSGLTVIHGDCLGADQMIHDAVREQIPDAEIHVYPPDKDDYRAFCEGDYIHPPRPYLVRNHLIVDACELLIALPSTPERLRSGTWSTVRYARKRRSTIVVIDRNGNIEEEQ